MANRALKGIGIAILCLCIPLAALGGSQLTVADVIRPGKAYAITFTLDKADTIDLWLFNGDEAICNLVQGYDGLKGSNTVIWDGRLTGDRLADVDVPQGEYQLVLTGNHATARADVTIGPASPQLTSIVPSDDQLRPGNAWTLSFTASCQGIVTLSLQTQSGLAPLSQMEVEPGQCELSWDGTYLGEDLTAGDHTLVLALADEEGTSSNAEHLTLTILKSVSTSGLPSPSDYSLYTCDHEYCFWQLPMGQLNEEAIWAAMQQPMYVVEGHQRKVVKLYAEPSSSSEAVGEVTCDSQGLHVIEQLDNGWSLVEAYSSSVSSSTVKVWAQQVTGYIKTDSLIVKEAASQYGLLLDKLNQQMYVFEGGKIISTLPISTGIPNKDQPYNETPAGEFMVVSWTGGFWSGNMYCDLALRINGGILLHEVPCLISDSGERNYAPFEAKLGQKASHGCIRIPRTANNEGINMKWLWDNLKKNTKVFIWDDVGRIVEIPDEDTPMYYNPNGGTYYHADQNCASVSSKYLPLTPITYGEVDTGSAFDHLLPCSTCNAPQCAAKLEAENEAARNR